MLLSSVEEQPSVCEINLTIRCVYIINVIFQDDYQGSATAGTVTSGTLGISGISVQNNYILFSDPERDRRQSASPRYLQKEAMHATQPRSL